MKNNQLIQALALNLFLVKQQKFHELTQDQTVADRLASSSRRLLNYPKHGRDCRVNGDQQGVAQHSSV